MSSPDARSQRRRRHWAWVAPVAVAGAIAATASVVGTSASDATPALPHRTAAQLIAAVARPRAVAFTGQVDESANLGLPTLPGSDSSASLSWQSFVTGSHSARVSVDGPGKQRIALLGELSEADVVHNGANVWTYTSQTNTVTHTTLPAKSASAGSTGTPADSYSPSTVANKVLAAITPSSTVSVDTAHVVAGRPTYTLAVAPKSADSTVRQVDIAIDATTDVPLRVQVFGSGSSPAFSVGFSSISYTAPSASMFDFSTPAGATVSSNPLDSGPSSHHGYHQGVRPGQHGRPGGPAPASASGAPTPNGPHVAAQRDRVIGSGWTTVLETGQAALAGGGLLDKATSAAPGISGGRELHTALLNLLIMPDGRVFVGAVSPSYLRHVATTTAN